LRGRLARLKLLRCRVFISDVSHQYRFASVGLIQLRIAISMKNEIITICSLFE